MALAGLLAAVSFTAPAGAATPRRVATNAPATYPFFGLLGDTLLYAGKGPASGEEPWRSDGTTSGTFLVTDILAGANGSNPQRFTVAGGSSFFMARDDLRGWELWKTNGTDTSTQLVKDIVPGAASSSPISLTDIGGTLYFAVHDGFEGAVYRSDGTEAGTQVLRGGLPPGGGNLPEGFTGLNGVVIFAANDGSDGGQLHLWRSDGTPAGTQPVGSPARVIGGGLASANGALFFTGHSGDFKVQVWRTDGTAAGTTQVSNLANGVQFAARDYGVSDLAVVGSDVYFIGNDANSGAELWLTDGTAQGTRRVADICPGTCSSTPRHLTRVGDVLYFTADDGVHGREVWRSQGTQATTRLLKDLRPGVEGSFPWHLTAVADLLYFSADDVAGSRGLWVSDGSEAGTRLHAAFPPGPRGSDVFNWVAASSRGVFIAVESADIAGQIDLWFADLACGAGDRDSDGIPNCVELAEGLDPTVKDNDIFTNARLFAMQQYRDFLGREGDEGGVGFWTSQLSDGRQTRAQMVETYFDSPEFQALGAPTARLYFAYFLRIPDYGGLTYWTGRFRAGEALEGISNAFAGSPEFVATYGSLDNAGFVDRVYRNVLGRPPESTGLAYWKGQLDAGMTRGQMMVAFSESAEYRSLIANEVYVTMLYVGMLRRAPDSGGFSYWVSYLDAGNSGLALIQGFLDGAEYRKRFLP